jgi:hypothetical protein
MQVNGASGAPPNTEKPVRRSNQRGQMLIINSATWRLAATSVALIVSFGVQAGPASEDCLFSDDRGPVEATDCQDDPLNLKNDPVVKSVLGVIDVAPSRVVMRGCRGGTFSTIKTRANSYVISYPMVSGAVLREYLGPIVHELGHVDQLEKRGSIPALRAALGNASDRIELGADFFAGVLLRRFGNVQDRTFFQRSQWLRGDYKSDSWNWHGNPVQRQSAFRFGFHYDGPASVPALNDLFQNEYFGRVKAVDPW